jgi:hypothetical protein
VLYYGLSFFPQCHSTNLKFSLYLN